MRLVADMGLWTRYRAGQPAPELELGLPSPSGARPNTNTNTTIIGEPELLSALGVDSSGMLVWFARTSSVNIPLGPTWSRVERWPRDGLERTSSLHDALPLGGDITSPLFPYWAFVAPVLQRVDAMKYTCAAIFPGRTGPRIYPRLGDLAVF